MMKASAIDIMVLCRRQAHMRRPDSAVRARPEPGHQRELRRDPRAGTFIVRGMLARLRTELDQPVDLASLTTTGGEAGDWPANPARIAD